MKVKPVIRNLIVILTLTAAASSGAVTAAGSAMYLSEGEYSTGLEACSISNRDITEVHSDQRTAFSSNQAFFVMQYSLIDEIAVEGRFGVADLALDQEPLDFSYGFVWGLSLRGIVFERPQQNLRVGVGLDYFDFSPKNTTIINLDVKPKAVEWQFSAQVMKQWKGVDIYGGFRYSEMEIRIKDFIPEEELEPDTEIVTDLKYKQRRNLAAVMGAQYEIKDNVIAGAEVQLFDGETLALRLIYKY